jgi:predicted transposase YdaD
MLQIHDIRESRVYQEAKEEGLREERRNTIAKLVAKKMTAGEIAKLLDLDVEQVQQEISNADPRS